MKAGVRNPRDIQSYSTIFRARRKQKNKKSTKYKVNVQSVKFARRKARGGGRGWKQKARLAACQTDLDNLVPEAPNLQNRQL